MGAIDPTNKSFKKFSTVVKEAEMEGDTGYVEAYANAYGNEDYDGDISMPGSFNKTIAESFKKLRVFKDHNAGIELGVPAKRPDTEDPYGLLTFTQFNMEKQVSRDMFSDVKLKLKYRKDVDLSIGFNVVKRDENDRRKITEYALWEYSYLSNWGANPLAIVQNAKSRDKKDAVIQFLTDAYDLPYSDPRLIEFEKLLKSLTGQEPGKPLLKDEPTDEEIKSLILKSFN